MYTLFGTCKLQHVYVHKSVAPRTSKSWIRLGLYCTFVFWGNFRLWYFMLISSGLFLRIVAEMLISRFRAIKRVWKNGRFLFFYLFFVWIIRREISRYNWLKYREKEKRTSEGAESWCWVVSHIGGLWVFWSPYMTWAILTS